MIRYEYKIEIIDEPSRLTVSDEYLQGRLSVLGCDGWMLCDLRPICEGVYPRTKYKAVLMRERSRTHENAGVKVEG